MGTAFPHKKLSGNGVPTREILRYPGMRFFQNFPEFRNFDDLRGHSRGNPRSGLIFMGGGVPYCVC